MRADAVAVPARLTDLRASLAARLRPAVTWLLGRTGRKWHRSFRLRVAVQTTFAVTCVLLGVQFARFVAAARAGATPLPVRPPGVEGFLPIGGLLGVFDWFNQGSINVIHPAATVLFLVFVALAVLLRKSFCSWICPAGFLSDLLGRLGGRLFRRRLPASGLRLPRWIDVPLRGVKYFLLAFFVWVIWQMPPAAVRAFIESPYYRMSDVKMGLFFVDLTTFGAGVLAFVVLASVLTKGFWCRYLCPYGALLGLFSWFSPTAVRRDPVSCIDCGLCEKACAARLPVARKTTVRSPECTGCLDCVAACPVKDALGMGVAVGAGRAAWRRRLSVPAYAAAVLALFLAGYVGARAAGTWHNGIAEQEYVQRLSQEAVELYAHPGL
jgi:hypothetical protein